MTEPVIVIPSTIPVSLIPILLDDGNLEHVSELLPSDAETFGWDAAKILDRWTGSVFSTVRLYWLQRTSDTAGYLDLPDPTGTLSASQIHAQAKAMLEYWDRMIALQLEYERKFARGTHVTFGTIKNRYARDCAHR